jgi:hypothetical protein
MRPREANLHEPCGSRGISVEVDDVGAVTVEVLE